MKSFSLLHSDNFSRPSFPHLVYEGVGREGISGLFLAQKCFLSGIKALAFISSSKATPPLCGCSYDMIEKIQELQPAILEIVWRDCEPAS